MEENKKDLYLPLNTPDSEDIIQGVGRNEIVIYIIGFFFCTVLGFIWYAISQTMLSSVLLSIGLFSLIVLAFRRDFYNENMIRKIQIFIEFVRSQKVYEYQYCNIHELGQGEE